MWHALIRTHHITSRRKVGVLKATTKKLQCYALLRSGGVPGVMYVQGEERDVVEEWVETVHELRYKDYQLVAPAAAMEPCVRLGSNGVLDEVATVKEMSAVFQKHGMLEWWRKSMGFMKED
jgi:hypothetical protein